MEKMLHFFDHIDNDFTGKDKILVIISSIVSWIFGINLLVSWGGFAASLMASTMAVLTLLASTITMDWYKSKLKDKLFKNKKHVKERKDKAA